MANPLDTLFSFLMQNILYIIILGLVAYVLYMYLKVSRKPKYVVIDREEVERQKFIEAMRLNPPPKDYKYLCKGDSQEIYIGNGNGTVERKEGFKNFKTLGMIKYYMEFEQTPLKQIEKEGRVSYVLDDESERMRLIGMVIKPTMFLGLANPLKKELAILVENDLNLVHHQKNKIVLDTKLGFDKFIGFYYALCENTKPKLRNIIDARILVQDFSLMASRYYAKGQEQAVYSPDVAQIMMQKEKELQIELAKSRGIQKSV